VLLGRIVQICGATLIRYAQGQSAFATNLRGRILSQLFRYGITSILPLAGDAESVMRISASRIVERLLDIFSLL
jgi:hypothetical protein